MREFKFRAWDRGNQIMIYPLPVGTLPSGELLLRWDDENLMQFTGLMSGPMEVFEGDIRGYGEEDDSRFEIIFSDGAFRKKYITDDWDSWCEYPVCDQASISESIHLGNIHENPELLS